MPRWEMRTTQTALIVFAAGTTMLAASGITQWIGASLQLAGLPVPAGHAVLSEHELLEIETMPPQEQALRLLERAINGYRGALEQIERRVDGWNGKLEEDQKFNQLTSVAYCASDLRVRSAAIEMSLAAYGLSKTPQSVDQQLELLRNGDRQKRFYPLWKLGLLGNRGVERETVFRALTDHLKDPEVLSRRWAVEAVGLLGTDDAIAPLLEVFRTDPSPEIRERAACNLADSGLLTRDQRRKAIPELMKMMDNPSLDTQTRGWVFQALREISGEKLGNEPSAWRNWWNR